jgi:hypothetical protein
MPTGAAWAVRIGALVVSVGVIVLTYRSRAADAPERPRHQPEGWYRRVGLINLAQFGVIALVVLVFINLGAPQFVPPLVCLIVGLHFIPLARSFDQPQYVWTAAGLCLAAVVGLIVLATGLGAELSRVLVGLMAAVTLWATSVRLALRP